MTLPGPLRGEQVSHERLRREEGSLEVHVHDLVVVLLADVDERGALLDPGVVDQDVERPELANGLVDQPAGLVGVGDVGLDQDAATAGGLDLGERLPRRRPATSRSLMTTSAPSRGEPDGDRPADPATAAR